MENAEQIQYSYWEREQYFKKFDLLVIGSGIVGLSTALSFKQKNKNSQILILERGFLPEGASTKNAGFACFGSAGELLSDLEKMPENIVWETLQMRLKGLQLLRLRVKDKNMDFHRYGGFELFSDFTKYEACRSQISLLNKKILEISGNDNCFTEIKKGKFNFKNVSGILMNRLEGQIDTGKMMTALLNLAQSSGITILNNVNVSQITESNDLVIAESNRGQFQASKMVIATNGFAAQLTGITDVIPARAQVIITSPIKGLKIRGTFHFDEGYYYFRNIAGRILFGGGRNMDIAGETTLNMGISSQIQTQLEQYLKEMIIPKMDYTIAQRWSGIMGLGSEKKPIVKKTGRNIVVAVRMGGMGIAIGTLIGELAANMIQD